LSVTEITANYKTKISVYNRKHYKITALQAKNKGIYGNKIKFVLFFYIGLKNSVIYVIL